MERRTKQRLSFDTAPLGPGARLTPGGEPRVWPWYAAGTALLVMTVLVAHVDVRADAPPTMIAGLHLHALAAPPAPSLLRPVVTAPAPAGAADARAPSGSAREEAEPDPLTARSLNSLGYAARKKGDHASARLLYREAAAVDARHVWSRFNLACELALLGDEAGALALLEEVARIGGPDADKALGEHAPRDEDLAGLGRHPRFRELTRRR